MPRLSSRQQRGGPSSLLRFEDRFIHDEEKRQGSPRKRRNGGGEKRKKGVKKKERKRRKREKNREGGGGNALTNNSGTWNENPRLSWANLLNYLIVEYLVDRHDVELISISLLPILGRPSQFPDKELGKYCRAELLISSSPFTTSA